MSRKPHSWRKRMFERVAARDGRCCASCGAPECVIWRKGGVCGSYYTGDFHQIVHRSSNLELDHRTALHTGGDNSPENLWLLCRACHQQKTSAEQSTRLKRLFAEARA